MSREEYPWQQLRAGESFFVPCIDHRKVMVEGRQWASALLGPRSVSATPGVYKGMWGVMFRLRR